MSCADLRLDNTRSNRTRVIKTPGGKLRYLHTKKPGKGPRCGDCGITLPGVSHPSLPHSSLSLPSTLEHTHSLNLPYISSTSLLSKIIRLTIDPLPPPSRIRPSPQE